jgi:DNA-binding response OmpR family regulator
LFDGEKRSYAKMQPLLKRVLIVDPQPAGARLLVDLMRDFARSYCWVATDTERALKIAQTYDPQLLVVEVGDPRVDGLAITRALRRSTWSARQAPVIAIAGLATAASILAARDAGVHEFLRKPYSLKDLVRRLEAVTLRERDWVEGIRYIGPDRRRFNSGEYSGSLKRRDDGSETPYQQKINQALKIIQAAVAASETDPQQALRAMLAQANFLQTTAIDFRITLAASEIYQKLTRAVQSGERLSRADAERWAAPLLACLKEDAGLADDAEAA